MLTQGRWKKALGLLGESVPHSVLIAEDEPNIAVSLGFLMERAGFSVRAARDGAATLRMIEEAVPDLLLLDIMMPAGDGFEVAAAVRRRAEFSGMRIVILTAKGSESDRRRGVALGVDDYITKPFSTRDVMARVHALLSVPAK
jgi:DNA-binding response OmpR family regulator